MSRPASTVVLFALCSAAAIQAQTVYQGTRDSIAFTSQTTRACPNPTTPIDITSTLAATTQPVPLNSVGCPAVTFGGTITLNHVASLSATVAGNVVTITTTPTPILETTFQGTASVIMGGANETHNFFVDMAVTGGLAPGETCNGGTTSRDEGRLGLVPAFDLSANVRCNFPRLAIIAGSQVMVNGTLQEFRAQVLTRVTLDTGHEGNRCCSQRGGKYDVLFTTVYRFAAPAGPAVTASPATLTFAGIAGGEIPPTQFVLIGSTSATRATFTVRIDDGAGGPAPDWAGALLTGQTPIRLPVSANPLALTPGTYRARLRIIVGALAPVDVAITFNVTAAAPKLDVSPRVLRFGGRVGAAGRQEQAILVRNLGGGPAVNFRTALVHNSSWLTVTPATGVTSPSAPQLIRVQANTSGLPPGGMRDIIRISSTVGDFDVTVQLFITQDGPILQVTSAGQRFTIRQNNGIPRSHAIPVLNVGSPGSTVAWTATKTMPPNTPDTVNITTTQGNSTLTTPISLAFGVQPTAATLPVGAYYTLIAISAPNAINSPQYVAVIVEVADAATPAAPEIFPPSLVFTGVANSTVAIPAQQATLFVSNTAAIPFTAGANTFSVTRWLNLGTVPATVNTLSPAFLPVSVNLTGLTAGVYLGQVDVVIAGTSRTITVTLIVLPVGAVPSAQVEKTREVTGCTPSRVVVAPGIIGNFSLPAGWPASLNARLLDDCGTALPGGSVVASFDNGDSPITLQDYAGTGLYLGTWTPTFSSAAVTIRLTGSAGTFPPSVAQIGGGVNTNRLAPPVLFDGGTVNNTHPLGGALLAPGTVTAVYGQNLATATASPGVIPLLTTFNGTAMFIGGLAAPFYFLSGGQLNVQAPVDLPLNQQASVYVSVNNALAVLPVPVDIVAASPGISSFADATIIAQHADFTLVDAARPSRPGESIVTYVSGMGATTPGFATGQQVPSTQLAPASLNPTVTVDGANATVLYGGLTPGGIGLYQINFTVPTGTRAGMSTVVITQNGVVANITRLPVGAP